MKGISMCLCWAALAVAASASVLLAQPEEWQRSEKMDTLRGTSYVQFLLAGKFLTPPRDGQSALPVLIVHCLPGKHLRIYNGKVLNFYVNIGTVLNSQTVMRFRLDDGKIQRDLWSPSTDGNGAFFDSLMLNRFLYGHALPHKDGTGPPVRKVVIAIAEYLAGEIVMQFDMPDPSQIQEACGVIAHKR